VFSYTTLPTKTTLAAATWSRTLGVAARQ